MFVCLCFLYEKDWKRCSGNVRGEKSGEGGALDKILRAGKERDFYRGTEERKDMYVATLWLGYRL